MARSSESVRARLIRGVLACGIVVACGDDEETDESGAAPVEEKAEVDEDEAEAPAATPAQLRRAYLAGWTECVAATSDRIEQAWRRYGLAVNVETGLPLDKEKPPFVYRVSVQLETCRVGDPPEGIDPKFHAAGKQYVEAATAVAEFTRELARYYDSEAYVEDAFAKGADTAPLFRAAYDAWALQHASFTKQLDTTRGEADEAWLDELEAAHDEGLRWRVARIALWGRTVAACVAREATPHTACRTSADDFHEVQQEIEAYCRKNPTEAVGVFWLDVLRRKAEQLDGAVKTATAPPPKVKPSKPKSPPPPDPARVAVARTFTEFVLAADRVRFDFP